MKTRVFLAVALLALIGSFIAIHHVAYAAGTTTYTGTIDGAAYLIQVPSPWNGTLVLYSHGYVVPGAPNPATDVGDPVTGKWLLDHGYALAGSSYSTTGWAVQQALHDQIALLDYFDQNIGQPTQTLAWGHSLGGMITAGLIQQNPDRFAGALPMCGVVAGGVGTWNTALDSSFAFRVLFGGNTPLQVVHISNPKTNLGLAEQLLAAAQATPQGRARIALVSALGDLPGWFDSASPEPASDDYATQELNQFKWAQNVDFPFQFAFRAELEGRAGGNPSWTTDVQFREQLARSLDKPEVRALYQQAGLNLEDDLAALQNAPAISADPGAVSYLAKYITYDGELNMPVLTMHTTGDGLVINEDEQAYSSVVHAAGDASLLRQVFVHRAGHCAFTPAETVTAFQTLVDRVNSGRWTPEATDPDSLNSAAADRGPTFNPAPPAFLSYDPTAFPRPFDTRDSEN